MIILGIETSCDETALALIEAKKNGDDFEFRVINSLIHSQAELHSQYGGVYPNLAKREHEKNLVPLFKKLIEDSSIATEKPNKVLIDEEFKSKIEHYRNMAGKNTDLIDSIAQAEFIKNIQPIDAIAVTEGPGLEPALWTGITFAKILGELWSIPTIPVNHMEGHVLGSLMESDVPFGSWQSLKQCQFPAVALLISGGHTEIVKIAELGKYETIGQTKDDAVGEAFDKVARLMELPYPGGPHISKLAQEATNEKIGPTISLPRPMINSKDLDFSFSGLKTAVLYAIRDEKNKSGDISQNFKKSLAHEFEQAVSDTLCHKLRKAIDIVGAKTIIIGGGVSANFLLRSKFKDISDEYGIPIYLPTRHISGDNALMIALVGSLSSEKTSRQLKADGTKKIGK